MYDQLEVLFAKRKLRLTKPRRTIFKVLQESDIPLRVGEITKKCPGVDRVSIYRTLELFTSVGITDIVPLGWKQRYELTGPFKPHHHHIYCTGCGKLVDIHSEKLEQLTSLVAERHGFVATSHKFEITGLCSECVRTPGTS